MHDPAFDGYQQFTILTDEKLFSSTSAVYRLCLYPTNQFFDVISTRNPSIATWGSVAIVIVISVLFFLYDVCVRIEFQEKQAVIETKRRFMRFVSHGKFVRMLAVYVR